jgi:phage shock protein C
MVLTLSKSDSWFGGVCGGIAHWLGWNSNAVRLLYVLATVSTGVVPGIAIYFALLLVMPFEKRS